MKLQTGELSDQIEKYKKEASNAAQERDDAKKAYDAHVSLSASTNLAYFRVVSEWPLVPCHVPYLSDCIKCTCST